MMPHSLDELCINTIRTLAIDAVQQAKSGHPGTPMAMAPVVYTLWQRFLRFDPEDPIWPNRDRFVLSIGHAAMLLYAMLHLTGVRAVNADYERVGEPTVTLDDIRRFRQLDSRCPGHPEYRWTSGVETTTGPLGQGCGNSVGMAIAARWLARDFNRPDFTLFDYDVFALCGDGDMMEGVASEVASVAGHLRLSNLCWIYDSNRVTIEGPTDITFSEDVAARFMGYGWNVMRLGDANDTERLSRAIKIFRRTDDRPTLIIIDSHIGYGAPHKQDTAAAHGEPLGEDEVRLAKESYGWPADAQFLVPDGVYEHFQAGIGQRGRQLREGWAALFERYRSAYPELADQIERMQRRELPQDWDADLPKFPMDEKGIASRDSSGLVLNALARRHPWLIGGAADLAPSTKTRLTFEGARDLSPENLGGRNLHFGVREHAMGSILNGLALSKIRAFGSGFLIFSDYMKPPIRLAALMELPVIYVFTHDSIGVGEDGPTHQPVEQLIALRSIPGLILSDFVRREVVEALVAPGVYERPPVRDYQGRYVAFTDPSGGAGDSFTVAIAHQESGVAVVDAARERRPPFSPEAVVWEYAGLLKQYGVHQVRGDRYAGEWPRDAYMKCGVHYWPSEKTKSEIYMECLPLLNGRRVELLDDDRLVNQICGLERRTARGGRDSVDHGPGGHDDVANAVLGAAWLVAGKYGVPQLQQQRLWGV